MLLRISLVMAVVFGAANLALWAWAEHAELAGLPFDVQSRALYELRLRQVERDRRSEPRAVFIGDSLVYGAHLAKTDPAHWQEQTLPAAFATWARTRGFPRVRAVNLGINGILYSDASCLVRDVLARKPAFLFVNVSPRPFASDFAAGPAARSERPFLCGAPSALENRLQHALPAWQLRDALQFAWFGTTPSAFVRERSAALVSDPFDTEDAELLAEAALQIKAAQRLDSIRVASSHPQAAYLSELLARLEAASDTRVVAFYLAENTQLLSDQLDEAHYLKERTAFLERVRAGLTKTPFVVLEREEFADSYVDHIHLTAAGYARLARRLGERLMAR